jgi:hypothetical protein
MLPDFPQLKSELAARLNHFLEKRMHFHLGALSEARKINYIEGDRSKMIRHNGDIEPILPTELKASISWNEAELPSITLEEVLTRLDEAAKEMAAQMARQTYASLSQTSEKAGTVVDAKNTPMRAELILEWFSQIYLDFNRDGKPQLPSIISHPSQSEGVKEALKELDRNPNLNHKFREIIETKREDWRVREASRRLVG